MERLSSRVVKRKTYTFKLLFIYTLIYILIYLGLCSFRLIKEQVPY